MKIKKILIVAGIIATIVSLTVSIYAYSTQPTAGSQYRLEGGIQSQEYYISTNYNTTPYSSAFQTAISNWCSGSDASFSQTTTYWDGAIDMYTYSASDSANGYTVYWVGTGAGGDNTQYTSNRSVPDDWWCSEVYVNRNYVSSSSTGSSGASAVMAHEVGHAFGFTENNTEPESIMCQAGHGRTASQPHSQDKDALDQLY
ncbi:MAG: hypothetical protein IKC03_10140 [Oscillospiraceae bacterium]|nr:hypothetical protein [Oscillospiraceae bacterium]